MEEIMIISKGIGMDALNIEAREMALNLISEKRSDVRDFVKNHETPAKLVLAIVRHLGMETRDPLEVRGSAFLDAVVNLQSLLELVDV